METNGSYGTTYPRRNICTSLKLGNEVTSKIIARFYSPYKKFRHPGVYRELVIHQNPSRLQAPDTIRASRALKGRGSTIRFGITSRNPVLYPRDKVKNQAGVIVVSSFLSSQFFATIFVALQRLLGSRQPYKERSGINKDKVDSNNQYR